MKKIILIAGFIVLVLGGLVYSFVPYTVTYSGGYDTSTHTSTSTMTGSNPLGIVVMFIGFTMILVGLFYKLEVTTPPETKQT